MRSIICTASLTILLLALGCNHIMPNGSGGNKIVKNDKNVPTPTVENLVQYLNDNAKRFPPGQALNSNNVTIDVTADTQQVGISARMLCQTPRNFLLSGVALGNPVVDIGSNDKEFWFWGKPFNPPYLYHCSYDALAQGNVKNLPIPFQPEMVLNALGLAPYDPAKKYTMQITDDKRGHRFIELTEQTRSLDNKPIQKVTVFNFNTKQPPEPQVVAHVLKDEQGRVICRATIRYAQRVGGDYGPIIPQMIDFNWPEQKMKMTMTINNPRFMAMPLDKAALVFNRQKLRYQAFDLATQALDGSVQQAGATGVIIRQ